MSLRVTSLAEERAHRRFQRHWGYLGITSPRTVRLAIAQHHAMGLCTESERRMLMRRLGVDCMRLPQVRCDDCRMDFALFLPGEH